MVAGPRASTGLQISVLNPQFAIDTPGMLMPSPSQVMTHNIVADFIQFIFQSIALFNFIFYFPLPIYLNLKAKLDNGSQYNFIILFFLPLEDSGTS